MNPTTRQITRQELETKLSARTPLVLLEALPSGYFQDKHLPTARNMPHDQVRALAPTLLPEKSAEIVVYCASATCQNSHIAANVLGSLGYQNVSVYPGGKKEWEEAGLPFEA
jgi:rhodanese-related sulfurtransferase